MDWYNEIDLGFIDITLNYGFLIVLVATVIYWKLKKKKKKRDRIRMNYHYY